MLGLLSPVASTEGDAGCASKLAHEALQLQERIGDVIGIVSTLETLAELAAANGRSAVAARLVGAAQKARETCGCRRPRVEEAALLRHLPTAAVLIDEVARLRMPPEAAARRGAQRSGGTSYPGRSSRVASLVATGPNNPEIAEQLMVSVKIVATHLTHIYRNVPWSDHLQLRRLVRERALTAG